MVAKGNSINRTYVGAHFEKVCELPNLVGIQLDSYERFLQLEKVRQHLDADPNSGLEQVFQSTFPIESQNGEMCLHYQGYTIDYDNIKFSELECKRKGRTYSVRLRLLSLLSSQELGKLDKENFILETSH